MKHVDFAKLGLVATTLAITALAVGPALSRPSEPQPGLFPIPLSDDLLLEFMQPKEGQDGAAQQWSEQHLKQFVGIPGVKAGQLLLGHSSANPNLSAVGQLSMYELPAAAASGLDAEVQARLQDGRLPKGDDLFDSSTFHLLYRPLWSAVMARDVPGTNPEPIGSGPVSIDYMLVMSNPSPPEQEDAYNAWYDHTHVPDVLRVPGFMSAQRYVRIGGNADKPRYLVIFKFKTRDADATSAEIARRIKAGITRMSPLLGGGKGGGGGVFVPAGPVALASGSR